MLEFGKIILVLLFFGAVLTPMYFFSRYLRRATKHIRGQHFLSIDPARIVEPGFYVNLGKSLIAFAVMASVISLMIFSSGR